MAHFAELDDVGQVIAVVAVNDQELLQDGSESEAKGIAFLQALYGHDRWKQTSYHNSFRGKYAAIGDCYDEELDVFVRQPSATPQ